MLHYSLKLYYTQHSSSSFELCLKLLTMGERGERRRRVICLSGVVSGIDLRCLVLHCAGVAWHLVLAALAACMHACRAQSHQFLPRHEQLGGSSIPVVSSRRRSQWQWQGRRCWRSRCRGHRHGHGHGRDLPAKRNSTRPARPFAIHPSAIWSIERRRGAPSPIGDHSKRTASDAGVVP